MPHQIIFFPKARYGCMLFVVLWLAQFARGCGMAGRRSPPGSKLSVATPKSARKPSPWLCSWRRANPGQRQHRSTAARARSSAVAAPERTFLTACPPSCTTHPAAHTFLLPSAAAPTTTSHSQQCSSGRNIPAPVRSPQRRKRSQPPPTLRHSGHIPAPAPQSLACCAAVPAHPSSSFRCSRPAALVPTTATIPASSLPLPVVKRATRARENLGGVV